MSKGNQILELNQRIYEFWQTDSENSDVEEYHSFLPSFFNDLKKSTLTIIGCNPSLNKKGYRKYFVKTPHEGIDFLERINKTKNPYFIDHFSTNIKELHDIEKFIGLSHPYVVKLRKVSEQIGIANFEKEVTVLDLFFVRDTNQKNIEKRIKSKVPNTRPIQYELTPFAKNQIAITMDALRITCPDMILIPNALASNIFIDYNNKDIKLIKAKDMKFYALQLNENYVPIFFSSMLSGQRALDTFSLERLIWDMAKILEKIKNGELKSLSKH